MLVDLAVAETRDYEDAQLHYKSIGSIGPIRHNYARGGAIAYEASNKAVSG